jgi:hypothetical protein
MENSNRDSFYAMMAVITKCQQKNVRISQIIVRDNWFLIFTEIRGMTLASPHAYSIDGIPIQTCLQMPNKWELRIQGQ